MRVLVLPSVSREIGKEPREPKESIFGVFERLEQGEKIEMPLCRPLFAIEKGLYELRFSYEAGEYRVFYYIKTKEGIYVIHAMKKKTQKLDRKTIDLLKSRIRNLL